MSDLICKNSGYRCQTPGMCAPHGGCRETEPVSSVWLAQLRSEFVAAVRDRDQLKAENKRLSELLECSQGDMRQADKIMERDMKDAERYRYIRANTTRGGSYDFCIVRKSWGDPALERILTLQDADDELDAAISKDAGQ
ncbi:hypothetical protein D3C76_1126920 [compost metagenome]